MMRGGPVLSEAEEVTQLNRMEALNCAALSYGKEAAPSTEAVLERAQAFYEWVVRKSEPAAVTELRR